MEISIDEKLRKVAPDLKLGIVFADVKVVKHDDLLWQEIDSYIKEISKVKLEDISSISQISALRSVYKDLGKDPFRYRGSSEALLRRIIQGKGLYKVNNIVDINNLVSLESKHSLGVYDINRISFPVVFRIGLLGESYKGIGKEDINISNLPIFSDKDGAFGSPTSDSERAMITEKTKRIMMIVIAFDGELSNYLDRIRSLLEKYAKVNNLKIGEIH